MKHAVRGPRRVSVDPELPVFGRAREIASSLVRSSAPRPGMRRIRGRTVRSKRGQRRPNRRAASSARRAPGLDLVTATWPVVCADACPRVHQELHPRSLQSGQAVIGPRAPVSSQLIIAAPGDIGGGPACAAAGATAARSSPGELTSRRARRPGLDTGSPFSRCTPGSRSRSRAERTQPGHMCLCIAGSSVVGSARVTCICKPSASGRAAAGRRASAIASFAALPAAASSASSAACGGPS